MDCRALRRVVLPEFACSAAERRSCSREISSRRTVSLSRRAPITGGSGGTSYADAYASTPRGNPSLVGVATDGSAVAPPVSSAAVPAT